MINLSKSKIALTNFHSPSKGPAFDRLVHWRRAKDFMEIDPSKGLLDIKVFSSIEPSDII